MKKIVVGIDPGFSGAIAFLDSDKEKIIDVYNIPVLKEKNGKGKIRKIVDVKEFIKILDKYKKKIEKVIIEQAFVITKQGLVSSGNYMKNYGILLGVISALGLNHEEVRPQEWKKELLQGYDKGKEASVNKCRELFSHISFNEKEHGKCDAILIALYGNKRNRQKDSRIHTERESNNCKKTAKNRKRQSKRSRHKQKHRSLASI